MIRRVCICASIVMLALAVPLGAARPLLHQQKVSQYIRQLFGTLCCAYHMPAGTGNAYVGTSAQHVHVFRCRS